MTSIVSICNLALSNIGAASINSLSEATAEARACSLHYEQVRDVLLQSYPWRFAGKTISLAEISGAQGASWKYAYQRPVDCLKVRWVRPSYSSDDIGLKSIHDEINIPYDIEGGLILCNLSPCYLRYTSKLVDPTKFPPLFIDALSWALSVRLAMPLTRDIKQRNTAYQLSVEFRTLAEVHDANEVRENSDHSSELVKVRY